MPRLSTSHGTTGQVTWMASLGGKFDPVSLAEVARLYLSGRMDAYRHYGKLSIVLVLCGCATYAPPGGYSDSPLPPVAQDINDAMAASMPTLSDGGYVCTIPTNLECVRTGEEGRFRCSYSGDGEPHRVTVVEQNSSDQWDERGAWRWVSGWRRCGVLYWLHPVTTRSVR